ncbi:biotin-dependent carboxyltransferase family protein [Bacillus solimangrovi]|uniref:KipI antagonist n=1 Tax=Bacillus solimangrovi TaxID=1305675 RepID=A0A1E5LG01_9BACI|nr:biotin-dependent carboxyltransferase family protein [Bacillus solimangrovi]OEH93002.1 KipI antagonist [Bacillus solimangrovi]
MKNAIFNVIKPGLLSTIQDVGRLSYQEYGISQAGAMDQYSLQVGNILVGNDRNAAALEITMSGPKLEVLSNAIIAITGADLSPTLNGEKVQTWRSFEVEKGQILEFGKPLSGIRAYICVNGGIDVPEILNSRSTYLKANLGGMGGRELCSGDIIQVYPSNKVVVSGRMPHYELIPTYEHSIVLHVIEGPHVDYFTEEGIKTFFQSEYTVTQKADRMGYRLKGDIITHVDQADILSDAIPFGAIQVPANGQPILLMADRQTTGGYSRIGTVISVDIPIAAQLQAGDVVRFKRISIDKAQRLYIQREKLLRQLEKG